MGAEPTPRIKRPAEDASLDEAIGFRRFWDGHRLSGQTSGDMMRGWWLAWARAYGQGVRASVRHPVATPHNPYPQFSGAWEAWATGYEDEAEGRLRWSI